MLLPAGLLHERHQPCHPAVPGQCCGPGQGWGLLHPCRDCITSRLRHLRTHRLLTGPQLCRETHGHLSTCTLVSRAPGHTLCPACAYRDPGRPVCGCPAWRRPHSSEPVYPGVSGLSETGAHVSVHGRVQPLPGRAPGQVCLCTCGRGSPSGPSQLFPWVLGLRSSRTGHLSVMEEGSGMSVVAVAFCQCGVCVGSGVWNVCLDAGPRNPGLFS